MIKKIVISSINNISAILHNNKTQEIISISNAYQVNDIYLGSVHKIFTSINAAFIKLDRNKKSGFIHINDIKNLGHSRTYKNINDFLSINQLILVQIIKEPTINKGPRLTANIRLYGRYFILMPFCSTVCISDAIYDDNEKCYLHALAILIKPATMGLLIRSSASGVHEDALLEDFYSLKQQWNFIQKAVLYNKCPALLYKDENLIKKTIKDFFDRNIYKIIVDSEEGLKEIYYYLQKWDCLSSNNKISLQLFKEPRCILEKFNVYSNILEALKPKVHLSLGGYIFIEHYEALTVIDVNSGSFNQTDNSRETILKTNCYAATEIAYQLKLRNLNGVIIIDFIDMPSHRDQLKLLEHFHKVLRSDRAKPYIVQLSELGLVELTRRRKGKSLYELFINNNEYKLNLDSFYRSKDNSIKHLEKNLIINKNINSLFFREYFNNKIKIYVSNTNNKHQKWSKKLLPIKLWSFDYNYIIPSCMYSKITDDNIYFI